MESPPKFVRSQLREAIETKNYEFLEKYLVHGINTDIVKLDEETPLQIALDVNDLNMVKFLLEHKVNPNEPYIFDFWQGYSPLNYALATKNADVAMLLIEYGADISARTPDKFPPIYFAIKYSQVRITHYLMSNGVSPDTLINSKLSLLNYAVMRGNIKIIKCILKHGPSINLHQHQQAIVAAIHTTGKHSKELVKMFYDYGFTLHPADINHHVILTAIAKGLYDVVLNMLKLGTSSSMELISEEGIEGTMLHVAVRAEEFKIVKLLLDHGADIHLRDTMGRTPILVAARTNNMQIIKLLFKYGANAADADSLNRTVLHCSIMENMEDVHRNFNWTVNKARTKIVKLFISKGADINIKTYHTRTSPLHLAAQIGIPGVVQLLLEYGARTDKFNTMRVTPLMYARNQISGMIINHPERHRCMELKLSTFQLLQHHICRLHRVGLRVRSRDLVESDIEVLRLSDDVSRTINDEINFIKKTQIGNTTITLHRFLTSTIKHAAGFARNDSLLESLKMMLDQPTNFPEYAKLIRNKLTAVLDKKELDRVTFKLLNFFFKEKELPSISDECTEYIMSFLSDNDKQVAIDQFTK